MTQPAKGYVGFLNEKNFKGRVLYSFILKNDDRWFRTGMVKPEIKKGDHVEFSFEEKDGGYSAQIDTITVLPSSSGEPIRGQSSRNFVGGGNQKDDYWANKESRDIENDRYKRDNDIRIQHQSARNAAITLVDILLREKALKLPESPGKMYDVIMGKITDLTHQFFEDTGKALPVKVNEDDKIPFET